MNLKKFISGVSALTIAASAFAGLAVTANAKTGEYYGFNWTNNISPSDSYLDFGSYTLDNIEKSSTVKVANNGGASTVATGTATAVYNKSAVVEGYFFVRAQTNYSASTYLDLQTGSGTSLASITTDNAGSNFTVSAMGVQQNTTGELSADKWIHIKAEFDYENGTMNLSVGTDEVTGVSIGDNKFSMIKIQSGKRSRNNWSDAYLGSLSYTGENLPYYITATPYSKVTVDGNVRYSKADGSVDLSGLTLEGGESITVEKNGYGEQNGTVDKVQGYNSFTLLPTDPTVSYYEDFAYVQSANTGSNYLTVSDGKLNVNLNDTKDAGTFVIPETDLTGKVLTINASIGAKSKSSSEYTTITISAVGVKNTSVTYNRLANRQYYLGGYTKGPYTDVVTSGYHDIQMRLGRDSIAGHGTMYLDGKHVDVTQGSVDNRTMTGLSFTTSGTSAANSLIIDSIKISSPPTEATVTGGGVDGTYLSGTTVTLAGTPESGSWYDGSDYYEVGDTYPVTENVTFEDKAPVTAKLDSISDVYEFTKGKDEAVTGAVLHVTVSNGSAKIAVKYNDGEPKTTTGAVSGSAVIGVIVNGTDLNLAKSNFTVDAVAVE